MAPKKQVTFATRMKRLEAIVGQLESETLDLEKAVALFEEGVTLSQQCSGMLTDAEKKVEILLKQGSGKVTSTEYDPGIDDDEEPSEE